MIIIYALKDFVSLVSRGDKQVKFLKAPLKISVSDETEVTVFMLANIPRHTADSRRPKGFRIHE